MTVQDGKETKVVETVDYKQPAGGQDQEVRNVQVIHQSNDQPKTSNTSDNVLSNSVAAVSDALNAAKDSLSGN